MYHCRLANPNISIMSESEEIPTKETKLVTFIAIQT